MTAPTAAAAPVPATATRPLANPLRLAWERFRRNRAALWAAATLLAMVAAVLFVPLLLPADAEMRVRVQLARTPPSWAYPFGMDNVGRDIFARCLWGGRVSLLVGAVSMTIAMTIGVTMGAIAGFYRGAVDALIMRFTDAMLAIPNILLLIVLTRIFRPSIASIVLIIGVLSWMRVARLVRANFLSLREQEFVSAAHAVGVRDGRIIFRHILPNTAAPVAVEATLGVGAAIVLEAAASFLGMGLQPPTASWGSMLFAAQHILGIAPWVAFFPGLLIVIAVLTINLVGEGLRDALDPRSLR
jgi:peptide/nickel transport system permease protein